RCYNCAHAHGRARGHDRARDHASEDGMPTPARQQYLDLKAQHPDALLWFRMGDFYELFDEDAQTAARELHLTLTSREFGRGERVPMAGVPHHASDAYLARL